MKINHSKITTDKLTLSIAIALSLGYGSVRAQFTPELELSSLDGSNGLVINGASPGDFSGSSVSYAGDINGDGLTDLIIGAPAPDANGINESGRSFVVFGSDQGFSSSFNLSNINGSNGFVINGVNADDRLGVSVSYAGDINADGFADLIIGSPDSDPNGNNESGRSYVVFGSDQSFSNPFNLSNINGSNGFVINGESAYDQSGDSVSHAGDINNDGFADLIIGAYLANANGNGNSGRSYVVFGSNQGFPNSLNLLDINGINGFIIDGINTSDKLGNSVSSAGDINGDGLVDLVIGAKDFGFQSPGSFYVIFGSNQSFANPFDLSSLDGSNGFFARGSGFANQLGNSVSGAGDINGDGLTDLIVGAYSKNSNGIIRSGSSYVIFGNDTIFTNGFE
ncbi:MAG: integrin alpha [Proteobacteria bacterium]|nr:integrin alpha [Pseudomonadota bacterium]